MCALVSIDAHILYQMVFCRQPPMDFQERDHAITGPYCHHSLWFFGGIPLSAQHGCTYRVGGVGLTAGIQWK